MCRTKMPLPHKKPPWKKIYAALPFVCKYCRGLFPDFKFYRRHIRSHESRYKKFWRSREWRAKRRYSTSYLDDIEDDGYAMDDDFYEATDLKKGKLLRRHSYDPDYLKKSGGRSGRSQGAVGKGPRGPRGGYTPRGITVEQAALIAHYQRMQLSKHKAPERFEYDSEDNMEDDEHVSSYHDVIMRNVGALFIQQIEQCKCKDCFKTEDHINMQNGKDVLTSKQSIDGTVVSNKQHRRDVVSASSRQAVRNKPLLPSDVNETQQENMPQMFAGNFPVSNDGKESGKLSPNVVTSASQTMLPCPHCPVSFDHADRLLLHIQNHYRLAKVQLAGASVAETPPTKVNKQQLSQIQLQQLRQQQQLEQLQQLHIAHSRKATKVTATAAQNLPIVHRQIQQQQNHQIQQQQQQQRHSQQLQQQSRQQQQRHQSQQHQSQQQQRHQSWDQQHQRHQSQQQRHSQQQQHQSQQQQTQRHQSQQQQQRHPSQQHQSQQQQQQRYQSQQQQQRHQSHQQQPHQHQKDQSHQQHQKQQVMQPREVSQIPHSMHHHQQPIKEPLIIQQQQQQRQQQNKKQVVSKHIDGQPIPQVQQQQWQQINQHHSHQRHDTMMQPTDTHQVNHQLKQIHDIYEPCIQTPSARASSVSTVTDSISVPSHLIPNNGSLNASNNNNSDTNSELPLSSADFKCSECDKAFVTEADLRVHLQYHQSPVAKDFRVRKHCFELVEDTQSQKPYSCSYCPKMFTYWSSLKTHEFTHTGNPPFACSVCDEKFTQSSDLKLHERTHFGANSFKCGKCGRLFKHRPSLTAHENSHHGEDGKNVCPVCLKNFSVGSNLRDHLRIHTGERPYECASCGRGFIQKSHLRKHVMIHTGERPFKCAYCSKGFTQRGDVRRHEKIHQKVK